MALLWTIAKIKKQHTKHKFQKIQKLTVPLDDILLPYSAGSRYLKK